MTSAVGLQEGGAATLGSTPVCQRNDDCHLPTSLTAAICSDGLKGDNVNRLLSKFCLHGQLMKATYTTMITAIYDPSYCEARSQLDST
jgi:hypothetical protein